MVARRNGKNTTAQTLVLKTCFDFLILNNDNSPCLYDIQLLKCSSFSIFLVPKWTTDIQSFLKSKSSVLAHGVGWPRQVNNSTLHFCHEDNTVGNTLRPNSTVTETLEGKEKAG